MTNFVNPMLPTHHAESKNGWNGANNDGLLGVPCRLCGRADIERAIFHGDDFHDGHNGHIVVCWPCSQTLGPEYYGCGCGG